LDYEDYDEEDLNQSGEDEDETYKPEKKLHTSTGIQRRHRYRNHYNYKESEDDEF